MGKKFCEVEHKWCKLLKHGICTFEHVDVNTLNRCKRVADIETTTLSTLVREVDFDKVFEALTHWFYDQEKSEEAYREVFTKLRKMKPNKHKLGDLFIDIQKVKEDDEEYLDLSGISVIKNNDIRYGMEFEKWKDWVSMFITNNTLNSLSKEEIVAACLYEMTFFGFEESKIQGEKNRMFESIEEMKKENGGNN